MHCFNLDVVLSASISCGPESVFECFCNSFLAIDATTLPPDFVTLYFFSIDLTMSDAEFTLSDKLFCVSWFSFKRLSSSFVIFKESSVELTEHESLFSKFSLILSKDLSGLVSFSTAIPSFEHVTSSSLLLISFSLLTHEISCSVTSGGLSLSLQASSCENKSTGLTPLLHSEAKELVGLLILSLKYISYFVSLSSIGMF